MYYISLERNKKVRKTERELGGRERGFSVTQAEEGTATRRGTTEAVFLP